MGGRSSKKLCYYISGQWRTGRGDKLTWSSAVHWLQISSEVVILPHFRGSHRWITRCVCYPGPAGWPRLGRSSDLQEEGTAKMYLHKVQAHAELVAEDMAGGKSVWLRVVDEVQVKER